MAHMEEPFKVYYFLNKILQKPSIANPLSSKKEGMTCAYARCHLLDYFLILISTTSMHFIKMSLQNILIKCGEFLTIVFYYTNTINVDIKRTFHV
jgi:hypothetical protein